MFGLRGWEWLIVLLIVLLIFGSTKLPQLGRGIGRMIRELREGLAQDDEEEEESARREED